MSASLPTGTVTFLFTDIEGSTALWDAHPEAMRPALARHDEILRRAIEGRGGVVFKTVGDAFCAVFPAAGDAVSAALSAQLALRAEDWGALSAVPVRMALHTGNAGLRDGDYFGPPLNRCARLLDAGHGGQCLLTQATEALVREGLPASAWLEDLGEHRLRDLTQGERIHQLRHPDLPPRFPPLRGLDSYPNNLPRLSTRFIGREALVEELAARLREARLLTLTGVGGAGKTRLSLEVAAHALPAFPDGVWLVELASLTEPASVPQAVVTTLGLGQIAGLGPRERLAAFFGERRMLLVLDNCEHLLDACARLAEELLGRCPELRILASSREGLGIGGEQIVALRSMSLAEPSAVGKAELTAAELRATEAARLFEDRASLVQPGFAITDENAAAVAGICRRLDGIPLALELAAARVRMMTPEEIEDRLERSFRLLTGGSRTALPRQQTLRATMDWSYRLLEAQEQAVLRRLSVFTGGWDLDGAVAVCRGETIEDWEGLLGPDQVSWLARCREEGANLLAAIRWAQEAQDPEPGIRIIVSCQRHWTMGRAEDAPIGELEAPVPLARRAALPEALLVEALCTLSSLVRQAGGDLDLARSLLDEAEERARTIDDPELHVRLLRYRALLLHVQQHGVDDEGIRLTEEAVARARAMGSSSLLSKTLTTKGFYLNMRGEQASALACLLEALDLILPQGDLYSISRTQVNLGFLFLRHGEPARARTHLELTLKMVEQLGNREATAEVHSLIGDAYLAEEDLDAGHRSYLRALELADEIGDVYNQLRARTGLAHIALAEGKPEVVVARGADWLAPEILWTTQPETILELLPTLARALQQREQHEAAAVVIGAREGLASELQMSRTDPSAAMTELERTLRDALGDEAYEEARARGRVSAPRSAVLDALRAESRTAGLRS